MSPDRLSRNLLVSALVIYSVALALASLTPVAAGSALGATAARRLINNLLHIPAYGLLTLLWIAGFRGSVALRNGRRVLLKGAVAALLFGGFMEVLQRLVPGRSGTLADFLLNGAGVLAAVLVMWMLIAGRNPEKRETEDVRRPAAGVR